MTLQQALVSETPNGEPQGPLIVHVVRQFLPNKGGLEDVVANLCRQLIARGYRTRVITLDRLFSDPDRPLAAREVIDGMEVIRVPWSGSTRYPLAPQVFRHLADADLVHVHAIDFFFDALAWSKPLHGRPMIATTHGGFFHTPKYATLKTIWFQTVTRLSTLAYDRLVSCSLPDQRLFSTIAGGRTTLIENGADIAKFANCAALDARRRIVSIGRFSLNKRPDRLLDVMQILAPRHPDWHLDIIGSPSDLTQAALEHDIAERGLGRNVSLHVSIDNSAIRNVMARASLFASASVYEGFGLVAVEAMSAGLLPVLHPNAAFEALAEAHPEVTLADFSKPQAAAEAFEGAFARLEEAQVESANLREQLSRGMQRYAWEHVAERYMEVYAEALKEKAGQPQPLRQRGHVA